MNGVDDEAYDMNEGRVDAIEVASPSQEEKMWYLVLWRDSSHSASAAFDSFHCCWTLGQVTKYEILH